MFNSALLATQGKEFIKSIFSNGADIYLKAADFQSNASIVIIELSDAYRPIIFLATELYALFSNHTDKNIRYSTLDSGSVTSSTFNIKYTTLDGSPVIDINKTGCCYFFG